MPSPSPPRAPRAGDSFETGKPGETTGRALAIFLLIRSLHVGGTERQLSYLATGLGKLGHDVTVAVYYGGGALEEDLRRQGVRLVVLGKRGRWDIFGFLRRLIAELKRCRPDILYSFLGTSNNLAAAVAPFIPDTKLVWSVRASDMNLDAYDWLARASYRVECALSRRADLVICNSQAGLEHAARNGFSMEKMVVVANGIDTERFKPDRDARARARAGWNVGEEQILIGTLARLDPMKDYPTFLRAAAQVARQQANVRFVCIGEAEPSLYASLQGLALELGLAERVVWAGRADDPASALNGLDIYCSTSITEGFSNAIAEAMACGLPCVVTDVGDSRLIVGDSGRVVPAGNPDQVARALLATLEEMSDGVTHRARLRVARCFSIEALLENTVKAMGASGRHF